MSSLTLSSLLCLLFSNVCSYSFLYSSFFLFFFFLNDPATPEISPLPLHDPLPISFPTAPHRHALLATHVRHVLGHHGEEDDLLVQHFVVREIEHQRRRRAVGAAVHEHRRSRSEEHTSELQSQSNLVCRLLLEKKKK